MTNKELALVVFLGILMATCVYAWKPAPHSVLTQEHVDMCTKMCGKLGVDLVQPDFCNCNAAPVFIDRWRECKN